MNEKKTKTRGQLISKLQHMKNGINNNLVRHIGYKDIDIICEYLLEDKHIIEAYKKELEHSQWVIGNLQKALDKACVILSHEDIYPCDYGEDNKSLSQCYKCNDEFVNVKECWKEWCMKGVKEDD